MAWKYRDPCFGEYAEGNLLDVHFTPSGLAKGYPTPLPPDSSDGPVDFEIVKVLSPFIDTVPCVVRKVSASPIATDFSGGDACPPTHCEVLYLLKLYDRRHFNRERKRGGRVSGPWNQRREVLYLRYITSGTPSNINSDDFLGWRKLLTDAFKRKREEKARSLANGTDADDIELDDREWNEVTRPFIGRAEAYIAHQVEKRYKAEFEAHRRIYSATTRDAPIPRFVGTVEYHPPIGLVKGVLLEYIPNSLEIEQYLLASATCGQLLQTVKNVCKEASTLWRQFLTEHPILFGNPSTCCILVQLNGDIEALFRKQGTDIEAATAAETTAAHLYRPAKLYIIGLSNTRFRYPDETDNEWAHAKLWAHELYRLDARMRMSIRCAKTNGCKMHGEPCRVEVEQKLWLWKPPLSVLWMPQWNDHETAVMRHDFGLGSYERRQERIAAVKELAGNGEETAP